MMMAVMMVVLIVGDNHKNNNDKWWMMNNYAWRLLLHSSQSHPSALQLDLKRDPMLIAFSKNDKTPLSSKWNSAALSMTSSGFQTTHLLPRKWWENRICFATIQQVHSGWWSDEMIFQNQSLPSFLFPIFQRQPPSKVPHPRFENTPQRWDWKEYPSTCLPWPNHPKYDQSLWRFAPICAHRKLSCSICQRPNFQHRCELHPVYPLRIWPIWHEWPHIEKVFGKEIVLECLSEIYI